MKYKEKFPNDTIKNISTKTNIQQTRVFRIFNGAEMKISEFFALEKLVINKGHEKSFINLAQKCFGSLSQDKVIMIQNRMIQNLKLNSLNKIVHNSSENINLTIHGV